MKSIIKILTLTVLVVMIFVAGLITGNKYQVADFLCPSKASPYRLEQDFESNSGIIIPKGTVVPVRECAYMQRINWEFGIDNAVTLSKSSKTEKDDYGYSELSPKSH